MSDAVDPAPTAEHRPRRLISPAVADAAAERGISARQLATLPGSGAGGRLLVVDLPAAPVATPRGPVAAVVPLTARQQARAHRAAEDRSASAQLTSAVEVDVTGLVSRASIREQGNAPADGDVRALILPDLVAAIATTLMTHPMLNARIDATAGTVAFRDRVDLGVVTSGPRGETEALIVDAGGLSVESLAHELATLRLLAMAGVQATEARVDATFTLFDRAGAPILFETPPLRIGTAASLALGWVERRPLAMPQSSDRYLIAWAGYLCLTYDHRLVDGADAARFLSDLSAAFAGGAITSDIA